jgi:hypothetical protein
MFLPYPLWDLDLAERDGLGRRVIWMLTYPRCFAYLGHHTAPFRVLILGISVAIDVVLVSLVIGITGSMPPPVLDAEPSARTSHALRLTL